MTAKKRVPTAVSQALADAAAAAFEDGAYDALDQALSSAIGQTSSAKALAQLIFDPVLGAASLGDNGFGAPVAQALVARAQAFDKVNDKARALAIAVRLCSAEPGAICRVQPEPGDENKALFREGLTQCVGELRELLGARAAAVKVAAAAVLAVVADDASDGAALLDWVGDKDRSVAATGLFGAAVIAARSSSTSLRTDVLRVATELQAEEPLLLRTCAAAAGSLLGQEADSNFANATVEALLSAELLPVSWGWYESEAAGKPAPLNALAARFASAVPEERRLEAIDKLANKRMTEPQAALVLKLGFLPGSISALGIEPDRIDPCQRKALAPFLVPPWSNQRSLLLPLGYGTGTHLKLLLEGVGPLWKPFAVKFKGEERQWPAVLVLRAVFLGELSEDAAVQALVEGLSDDDLVGLLGSVVRHGLSRCGDQQAAAAPINRVQEVLLRLWQWLESDGGLMPDEAEQRAAAGKDRMSEGLLLLWHATTNRGRGASLDADVVTSITRARKLTRGPEPFDRLIAELSEPQQLALDEAFNGWR